MISEFLTHTFKFGVGSVFSKGQGSGLSEGHLYKVCRDSVRCDGCIWEGISLMMNT